MELWGPDEGISLCWNCVWHFAATSSRPDYSSTLSVIELPRHRSSAANGRSSLQAAALHHCGDGLWEMAGFRSRTWHRSAEKEDPRRKGRKEGGRRFFTPTRFLTRRPREDSHHQPPLPPQPPPSGSVITHSACWKLHLFLNIFPAPLFLPARFRSIFIPPLNAIPSPGIRYQPGCPLLFGPVWGERCWLPPRWHSALLSSLASIPPTCICSSLFIAILNSWLSSPSLPEPKTLPTPPLSHHLAVLPHLSLALNQMERIKSGMHGRQWLLWLPAVFGASGTEARLLCAAP